jgi:hypothetical protein
MKAGIFPCALLVSVLGCTAAELPRVKWLSDGLIDAGGSHEPYTFTVRVGGQSANARQQYERQQSEEVIRRLHDQGVEVFHTHLYKGFGMEAEAPEMEDARRAAAIAHRLGMKVDSYIQWNTMMYETFFAEEPRAMDWVQRDAVGKPIMLVYGFEQSFRYRPCFSNPNYLDYLKRIVRYGVEQVKTDFIHFDNFDLNKEPESCHCKFCTRGFREYLKAKYTPAQRRDRFGFENVDYVNPPMWNEENDPRKLDVIRDPGLQEWIAYRCHEMSEALRQMAEYARSMNPEVAIEVNPHGITGENRAWEAGLDHPQFLKWTDAFWTEEPNVPHLEPDGRLVSRIRSYKLARAFHNILLSVVGGNPVALAEDLAFNQTIAYLGEDPLRQETLHYLDFYRRNRALYRGTEDDPTVAVLRSYPSITYDQPRAQLAAVLVEQALIQARVPFRLIFDEHLADLSPYKVLVLPGSECLTDAQVEAIKAFVAKGGGLVATGEIATRDEWYRRRAGSGLQELLPGQRGGGRGGFGARGGRGGRGELEPAATVHTDYQSGRAAYIASMAFDGPLPRMGSYFGIRNQFWKNPKNAAQLVEAVRWASHDAIPLTISGPAYLVANLVQQPKSHRSILHLVNYDAANTPSIAGVDVAIPTSDSRPLNKVTLLSPDSKEQQTLAMSADAGGKHFRIREVRTYSVVVMEWQ